MSGSSIPRPLIEQAEAVDWAAEAETRFLDHLHPQAFAARSTTAARAERLRAAAETLRGLAALTTARPS